MPPQLDLSKLSVRQFAEQFRGEMIPLNNSISYFCASLPMTEEDLREYLQEPVAALPPAISSALPRISILLVPYLERSNGRDGKSKSSSADYVCVERTPEARANAATLLKVGSDTVLAFALKDREMADYHYRFFHQLATLLADRWDERIEARYSRLLRDELNAEVRGEVDEESWRLKQTLRRSKSPLAPRTFSAYAKQSFVDTLTLYLHGICCDIDVETGPRQLPSRYLRKRLLLLHEAFPPPQGYALFPDEINS